MTKRINFHFVFSSFVAFAVLASGVYFFHAWQYRRETGFFLDKAQQAKTEGDLLKAIDLYGKYLVLAPKDNEARSQFGSLLFDIGAYAVALQTFEKILRLEPGRSG